MGLLRVIEPPKLRRVEIDWLDAQSRGGWASLEQMRHDVGQWHGQVQRSAGYVIADDETGVALVQTLGCDDNAADMIWIPRTYIKAVKELRR